MRTADFILAVTALIIGSAEASAHHSYAMFDLTRQLTVKGTVGTLEWTNPHIWIFVDVPAADGSTATYGFESNAPSELTRFFGWTRRSVNEGDAVTIEYSPLRSGKDGGVLLRLTLPDGRVLDTPRSRPVQGAAARANAETPAGATIE